MTASKRFVVRAAVARLKSWEPCNAGEDSDFVRVRARI
jgi:hypothetical protein